MDVRINFYEAFKEAYGFVAGDDVLRFTAMLIGEVLDELGTSNDFVGHAGGDNFVIITAGERANAIRERMKLALPRRCWRITASSTASRALSAQQIRTDSLSNLR